MNDNLEEIIAKKCSDKINYQETFQKLKEADSDVNQYNKCILEVLKTHSKSEPPISNLNNFMELRGSNKVGGGKIGHKDVHEGMKGNSCASDNTKSSDNSYDDARNKGTAKGAGRRATKGEVRLPKGRAKEGEAVRMKSNVGSEEYRREMEKVKRLEAFYSIDYCPSFLYYRRMLNAEDYTLFTELYAKFYKVKYVPNPEIAEYLEEVLSSYAVALVQECGDELTKEKLLGSIDKLQYD